ncbi:hypothetical protein HDE_05214 [Halotydeus destructor]|nr:hypothetical protein HDE_05214 [Halotydeus destructor]
MWKPGSRRWQAENNLLPGRAEQRIRSPKGGLQPSGFIHTTRGTCIDHIEDQSQHNFEAVEAASKEREEMKAEVKTLKEEMKTEIKTLKEEMKTETKSLKEECAVNLEAVKVDLKQSTAELDDGFTKTINEQVDKTNANFEELTKANASLALETKKLSARCRDIHDRTKHLEQARKVTQTENNDSVLPLIQPYVDQIEKLVTNQVSPDRIAVLEQSMMEAKQLNQKHLERIAVLEHSLANQPSIQPYIDRIASLEQSLAANQPSIQACLDRIAALEASASNPCRADLRVQLLQDSVLRLSRVIRNIQPRPPTF